jgi:hypothetical protein
MGGNRVLGPWGGGAFLTLFPGGYTGFQSGLFRNWIRFRGIFDIRDFHRLPSAPKSATGGSMGPDATIGDRCPPFLRPFARAATLDSANVEVDFPPKEVCLSVFLSKRIKKEVSGFQDPQGDQGVLKSGKPGCSFWIPCHSAGGNNLEIALFSSIGPQTSRMSSF